MLVVHPAFSAKSVPELVAHARANPGKLNYGSAGHGNATHLAAELFKLRTGVDIVHVPYKGAADAVTGVLGGQVQMFFGDIGGTLPLVRDGALRALAVSSERRNALLPDVPTMMESGVPDYVVLTYIGVVAPAGTPEGIIGRLNAAINESLAAPEVTAAFAKLGAEVQPGPPQDFGAFLAAETQKWSTVARSRQHQGRMNSTRSGHDRQTNFSGCSRGHRDRPQRLSRPWRSPIRRARSR